MKLGFVSAILDGWTFEEMMDTAAAMGFSCVEVACWPTGKAERRYAGVSHIDVEQLSDQQVAYIQDYSRRVGVEISSLAFYPNTMDADLEKRQHNIAHLKKVIEASSRLGVVDWGRYSSALTDIGYDLYTCIEVEDRAFEGSRERILDSLRLSKRYMEQFVI